MYNSCDKPHLGHCPPRGLEGQGSPPRGLGGQGRSPRGLGGPPAPPWATAAVAVGPGVEGGDILGWGHIRILYKAPTGYTKLQKDYTKHQQTIQSPDRLYKAPNYYTKI